MLTVTARIAVFLAWALASLVVNAQTLPLTRYDLNVDGVVSSLDAFELRKCYGKPAGCDPRADFDNDGTITVKDLSLLAANYGRKVPPTAPLPATSLVVSVSKSIVKPGESFTLRAQLSGLPDATPVVRWYLPGNVIVQGAVVTRSLSAVALAPIDVTVQLSDGRLLTSGTMVTVTDVNGKPPAFLSLPDRLGDVDGSGSVTLIDAYRVYRQLAGVYTALDSTARNIADFDRDGKLTAADARHIALAAISGSPYAESLSPERLMPGTIVTLRSAALVNPAAELTVRVDGSNVVQKLQSVVPGLATFQIPFDLALTGASTPSTVTVLDGAIERASFPVRIAAPPAQVADPQAVVIELFRLVGQSLTMNTARVSERALAAGLSATDQVALKAFAVSGERQGMVEIEGLIQLLRGTGGKGSARLIAATLQANGFEDLGLLLSELRAGNGQSTSSPAKQSLKSLLGFQTAASPTIGCDLVMEAYCPIRVSGALLSDGATFTQFACAALLGLGVGAVLLPEPILDPVLLSAWVIRCSGAQVAIELASNVGDLLGAVDADLTLTAAPTSLPVAGQTSKLVARLNVGGADDICQLGGALGGQAASQVVANRIVNKVINRLVKSNIGVRLVLKSYRLMGEEYAEAFVRNLSAAATQALTKGTIDQAIKTAANALCPAGGLCDPLIDTRAVLKTNADLVFPQPDRSAQFICPVRFPGDPSSYTFASQKRVCGDDLKAPEVEITCGGKMVTITMGDNGSALDDIYEVVIDETFILTSGRPERVVSGIFELPAGVYTVQMFGRAAPDGIGTYYISFSGARLLSGDATSGTDLTPGRVKTFQIEVQ